MGTRKAEHKGNCVCVRRQCPPQDKHPHLKRMKGVVLET